MTTHSVCQPGRPRPHGDSQLGSPSFAFFQRAKSSGERLSSLASTRAPDLQRLQRLLREEAVPVDLGDLQVDAVGRLVGHPLVHQVAHQRHHVLDVLRGVRDVVRAQIPQGVHGLPPTGLEFGGHVGLGAPQLGRPA